MANMSGGAALTRPTKLSDPLNLGEKKPAFQRVLEFCLIANLDRHYVSSRRAFGTVSDFKLYALTFSQSFETIALDCREVYEHVFAAIFRSNETESFGLIKPLNVTFNLRHQNYLYMKNDTNAVSGISTTIVMTFVQSIFVKK